MRRSDKGDNDSRELQIDIPMPTPKMPQPTAAQACRLRSGYRRCGDRTRHLAGRCVSPSATIDRRSLIAGSGWWRRPLQIFAMPFARRAPAFPNYIRE